MQSTSARMLERLVQLRWLRRSGRDYELGMRLVELGSLAVHQDRLVQAARPLLNELHRATGLVAHLAVLDGPTLSTWKGRRSLGRPRSRPGSAVVSRHTAPLWARRSWLSATTIPRSISKPARRGTRFPRSSQLTTELAKVRARGIAFEREESKLGFGCVAAPIGNPGEAVAAVSVCGPMSRMMFDQRLSRPDPDDGNEHLAQRRRRPTTGGADAAATASIAAVVPLHSRRRAVRVSLDYRQLASLIEALDAGFPPVHTMTGTQARATIRSRFVPPRPRAGGRGSRRRRIGARRRHPGTGLPARTQWPPADAGVRTRRRLRILRPGQPRWPLP